MNRFVHSTLRHFLQKPLEADGDDLGGSDLDDQQEEEEQEEEKEEESEEENDQEGDDESVTVTIAGEKAAEEDVEQQAAPKWVKDLRKDHREAQKRIRELEAQVNKPAAEKQAPVLGKKPTMEDSDVDWDADKFEEKLTAWHDKKREIEEFQRQQQHSEQQQKTEWEGRLATYATSKTGLKVRDFDEAEENVQSLLNVTQQGIIIQGADNSALVVYALGKNPKKAAELAGIKDAVKFAFAIAKLETQLKVQSKKSAPAPEKVVSGQGRITGSNDKTLERLRAEAEKTGDVSKIRAYKAEQKRKQQK